MLQGAKLLFASKSYKKYNIIMTHMFVLIRQGIHVDKTNAHGVLVGTTNKCINVVGLCVNESTPCALSGFGQCKK
jgi:hypothetical protein